MNSPRQATFTCIHNIYNLMTHEFRVAGVAAYVSPSKQPTQNILVEGTRGPYGRTGSRPMHGQTMYLAAYLFGSGRASGRRSHRWHHDEELAPDFGLTTSLDT